MADTEFTESEEAMARRWAQTATPPDADLNPAELRERISKLRLMVYRAEEASGQLYLKYISRAALAREVDSFFASEEFKAGEYNAGEFIDRLFRLRPPS